MDESGTVISQVTNDLDRQVNPSWSPDGRSILFEGIRDDSQGIFMVNLATQAITRITDAPSGYVDIVPLWSPQGDTIVFTRGRTEGVALPSFRIHRIDNDGSNLVMVTKEERDEVAVALSKKDEVILASRFEGGNNKADLYFLDLSGTVIARITDTPDLSELYASFSPDGTMIVVSDGSQVWILDEEGNIISSIAGAGALSFAWPDWGP